ncbi:MAG: hypothetical protein AAGL98_11685, partial [Planctomycetota bacterium]
TVSADRKTPRFVVPRSAVRAGRIQIVEDGQLVSRAVEIDFNLSGPQPALGLRDDQWAVIADGVLQDGDLVVANASTRLADGTEVVTQIGSESSAGSEGHSGDSAGSAERAGDSSGGSGGSS